MQSPLEQKKQMIEQLRRLGGVGEQRRIIEYAQAPFVPHAVRRRLAGGGVSLTSEQLTQLEYQAASNTPDIYFYNRVGTNNENGYFGLDFTPTNDDLTFFDNPVVAPVTETQGTLVSLNITAQPQYNSILLLGYFLAPTTETYTFFTNTDDASYMWIGPNAISGYTHTNAVVQNGGLHGTTERSGTISLTQNIYYPIRIMFGNNSGPGTMIVSYSTPTIAKTSTWTGRIFHNSATNGF
jgi:hypothetical protein